MKQHFTVHEREPGNGIAGRIADIPTTGWSASSNKEYYGVPGYAVDMEDDVPVRIYRLPDGLEYHGIVLGVHRIETGRELSEAMRNVIDTIQTEVESFHDWSDKDVA